MRAVILGFAFSLVIAVIVLVTRAFPTLIQADISSLSTWLERWVTLITDLLKAVVFLVFLILALWLLRYGLFRPRQLVVQDLTNATAIDGITNLLPGLSMLMRQWIARHAKAVKTTRRYDGRLLSLPRPDVSIDNLLNDLTTPISSAAPAEIRPLVQILPVLFPPRGTLVTGTVQQWGENPGELGITFTIVTLDRRRRHKPYTVWESGHPDPPSRRQPVATAPPQAPAISQRCMMLVEVATQYLAVKLYKLENRTRFFRNPLLYLPGPLSRAGAAAALYHLNSGLLYLSGASPTSAFLYALAEDDIAQAQEDMPAWWQPYVARGDMSIMKATDSTLTNEEQQAHLASAQASYETALVKVREMRMSRWQHTFLCDPDVGPRGLRMAAQRCAGDQQGGLRRIQIGLALTHLRRGDTEKSAGYMRQAEDGWQRLQETKSALLYSAAIYYAGVATRTQAQGAGALARAYLVASFACASAPRSVAQTAASDPDLTAVLTDSWRKDIPTLIAELELFPPKKRTLVVRWNIITKSLDAATWDTERRYLEPSAVADPARAASSYRRWRRVLTSVGQRRERG